MNAKPQHQNEPILNPIGARLQLLMAALKTDLAFFSKCLGCPEPMLAEYLSHPTGANLDFLATLLATVNGVSAEWLLTGRGSMVCPGTTLTLQQGNSGTTVGTNHGLVLHVTCSECQEQLKLATLVIKQQRQMLDDKDRIIKLLDSQQP